MARWHRIGIAGWEAGKGWVSKVVRWLNMCQGMSTHRAGHPVVVQVAPILCYSVCAGGSHQSNRRLLGGKYKLCTFRSESTRFFFLFPCRQAGCRSTIYK